MAKKIEGTYKGHLFTAINRWFGGLKLYHNKTEIAHYKGLTATNRNIPLIAKELSIEGVETKVEVYGYAISKVLLQIRVNGQKIAGDDF